MDLQKKVIIITGASEGIGKALAKKLAPNNYLILVGRNYEKLNQLIKELGSKKHLAVKCDISNLEQIHKAYKTIEQDYSNIDLIINNAGISSAKKFDDYEDSQIRDIININVTGSILFTKTFIKKIILSKGAIVNIGSMFGEIAHPCYSIYSASKFAIKGFSDSLRRELSHLGVRVFYISPRATKTQSLEKNDEIGQYFKMNVDEPEKVANYIIEGISNNQSAIYPKSIERFFLFIQKFFTKLIDNNLSTISKKIYSK